MKKYVNGELVDMTPEEIAAREAEEAAADQNGDPVPASVSMFQARAVLWQMGMYEAVDQALQTAGGVNLLAWEYAVEVRRDSPLVSAMADQLSLTLEQVDEMFRTASTITA